MEFYSNLKETISVKYKGRSRKNSNKLCQFHIVSNIQNGCFQISPTVSRSLVGHLSLYPNNIGDPTKEVILYRMPAEKP